MSGKVLKVTDQVQVDENFLAIKPGDVDFEFLKLQPLEKDVMIMDLRLQIQSLKMTITALENKK